jgi:hypothetical protein
MGGGGWIRSCGIRITWVTESTRMPTIPSVESTMTVCGFWEGSPLRSKIDDRNNRTPNVHHAFDIGWLTWECCYGMFLHDLSDSTYVDPVVFLTQSYAKNSNSFL